MLPLQAYSPLQPSEPLRRWRWQPLATAAILAVAVPAPLLLRGASWRQAVTSIEAPSLGKGTSSGLVEALPEPALGVVAVDFVDVLKVPGSDWLEQLNPGPQFCNASARVLRNTSPPRTFVLPEEWEKRCREMEEHPNGAAPYPDRNWCWAWMKYEGCLWTRAHWSWWEAQQRLAAKGKAPDPHHWPMRPLLDAELCERPVLGRSTAFTEEEARRAQAWVVQNVAVYVLNLPSDTQRWTRMVSRLRAIGLTAERVFGVDMTKPGMLDEARNEGLVPQDYIIAKAQKKAEEERMGGITGTVGVASAHFRALGRAYDGRGKRPLALILEDDTELVDDFSIRLWRLLAEAPCDWAAISLKSRCGFGTCATRHLTRVLPDGNEPADRCHHGVNYGFYAMLYRAERLDYLRQRLRTTVWREDRPHCLDIDVALASISDEVPYYAVPAVQEPGFLHEGSQGSARYTKNSVRLPYVAHAAHAAAK